MAQGSRREEEGKERVSREITKGERKKDDGRREKKRGEKGGRRRKKNPNKLRVSFELFSLSLCFRLGRNYRRIPFNL